MSMLEPSALIIYKDIKPVVTLKINMLKARIELVYYFSIVFLF